MTSLAKLPEERPSPVFNPLFLASLLILLVNDAYLKTAFGNAVTGKLSDFTGLVVFPVVAVTLFPACRKWIVPVTGTGFIFWKTPLATPLIDFVNDRSSVMITRTIDYTDYWALLVLPLVHFRMLNDSAVLWNSFLQKSTAFFPARIIKVAVILLSCFAVCATSAPHYLSTPKGTVYLGKYFTIKKPKQEIIDRIKALGYNIAYHEASIDSSGKYRRRLMAYYQSDNVVLFDEKSLAIDTILNVKYNIVESAGNPKTTYVEIINVTLRDPGIVQRWQNLKYLHKQYAKLVKKNMIEKIEK